MRLIQIASAALLAGVPALAAAQMPGVPVLQNAWANPGITAAVNAGWGDGSQTYGGAAAWTPGNGRFQIAGGVGYRSSDDFGGGFAYGVRGTVPIVSFAGEAIGIAGFLGVGGAGEPDRVIDAERGGNVVQLPIGASIGYRRALSFLRGVSAYASPAYTYSRATVGDSSVSAGVFRIGLGLDVGITSRIGVTVGAELGGSPSEDEPGPRGTIFGVGGSFALGRRE